MFFFLVLAYSANFVHFLGIDMLYNKCPFMVVDLTTQHFFLLSPYACKSVNMFLEISLTNGSFWL